MDALVKSGIELNRHYVHMMCTPTRASFQSGRLPIHVLTRLSSPCDENGAIPRNMTGIAAQLKAAGYGEHISVNQTSPCGADSLACVQRLTKSASGTAVWQLRGTHHTGGGMIHH